MNKRYYFILTNKCNMNCEFCYEKNKSKLIESDINIIRRKDRIDHLVLIGGEPLLEKAKLISIVEEFNKKVNEITIVTNGLLVDKDIINLIHKYKNVYLQVSIYNSKHLETLHLINSPQVLYHILITDNNIYDVVEILTLLEHYFVNRIWISIDRFINTDISETIRVLIRQNIIKREMFRDIGHVGKKCGVLNNNSNIVINGNNEYKDCLARVSSDNNRGIEISKKCLKCDNIFCDACVCEDIVSNRDLTCKIFNTIREEFTIYDNRV